MTDQETHNEAEDRGPGDAAKVLGWREWLSLPDLGIARIKAKIDTGAHTSSLHAAELVTFERDGKSFVRFTAMPIQRDDDMAVGCEAEVIGFRKVRSSTGQSHERPVIVTTMEVCGESWPIEVTLADRNEMGFRMLLGREALRRRFLVDAGKSFLAGE
jgi:hypothetical protein